MANDLPAPNPGRPQSKKIESIALQKDLMDRHYQKATEAHEKGIPVVWTAANFPVELIYAMDMVPVYPENLAVRVLMQNQLLDLSNIAESEGYSSEICSYARCNLGSVTSGKSPIGPLPQPDILCISAGQCFQIMKWYEVLSRHFKVPYYILDTGFVPEYRWDKIILKRDGHPVTGRSDKQYFKRQAEEFVTLAEGVTKRKLDYDRLREVMDVANHTYELWFEIMDSARQVPSPISLFDLYVAMSPLFNMRGTREALEYYQKVRDEVAARAEAKIPAVPGEKLRLHYENMPLWHSFREDRKFFTDRGASLLTNLYLFMFTHHYEDLSDPLGALAAEYERVSKTSWGGPSKAKFITQLIDRFHLDGFLMHNIRTCKNTSLEIPHIAKMVTEHTGIPGLVFEADHGDTRFYDESKLRQSWDTYIDMLTQRKQTPC